MEHGQEVIARNKGYRKILFQKQSGIASITLNRPDAANAVDLELSDELWKAVLSCSEDKEIRVVFLTGAGRFFCGGGDLDAFRSAGDDLPLLLKRITVNLHSAVAQLSRLGIPLVVAVNGAAGGFGLSLASLGDIVIAASSAKFAVAYANVGLSSDGGLSYFLPRKIGMARAVDLMLTGRAFTAEEGLAWGLISRVVPNETLQQEAWKVAVKLADGPTRSFGSLKKLAYGGWSETLETQLENERQAMAELGRSRDAREGITAFLEKRVPRYQGL